MCLPEEPAERKEEAMNENEIIVAEDREESEPCEAGTVGCCVDHHAMMRQGLQDDRCETW